MDCTTDLTAAYRALLCDLLVRENETLLQAWMASDVFDVSMLPSQAKESVDNQARRFLKQLAIASAQDPSACITFTRHTDAALMREYPLIYHLPALFALEEVIIDQLHARGEPNLLLAPFHRALHSIFAVMPAAIQPQLPSTARLAQLNQLSWQLNNLLDEDAIMDSALRGVPELVEAESSAIWMWDSDQSMPVMMVTEAGVSATFPLPNSFLSLLRQACSCGCAFSVDAGETEASWPAELRHHAVAFAPLQGPDGCIGLLTAHKGRQSAFSHDDLLLLSSLGNFVAIALQNTKLYATERHLSNLLQTSIRQVVQASSGQLRQHQEFVQSLLHVAEGLTHAEAVGAWVASDERTGPVVTATGTLAHAGADALHALASWFWEQRAAGIASCGVLAEQPGLPTSVLALAEQKHYVLTEIRLDSEVSGLIYALHSNPLGEGQQAFLRTIAEQIGVGTGNMLQSANIQRLLFELSNVNYVSEAITGTFDPQRIMSLISQAAGQALNVPLVLCGWLEEDGTLRVLPSTAHGVTDEHLAALHLTYNNTVVRKVLDTRLPITSTDLDVHRARTAFSVLSKLQMADWVCVPMVVKSRARGIMLVADARPHQFSRRETALLSTYANQAALAMENSLLYEQIDRQLQQMEWLYQVTRSVSSSLDLQEILAQLLRASTEAMQVPVALICLMDGAGREQRLAAVTGVDDALLAEAVFLPGEGLIGSVGERGTPLVSMNLARDGRAIVLRELAQREGLASAVTVPLQVQGSTLGTLTVISRTPRDFSPADIQLLEAMVTEAAVAVHNARQFESERERVRQLSVLIGEVTRRVSDTLGVASDVITVSRDTEMADEALDRLVLRFESLAGVLHGIVDDTPTEIYLKEAFTSVLHDRLRRGMMAGTDVRVTGAQLPLSSRLATLLALFLNEWLVALEAVLAGQADGVVVIAFQQVGREVIVQIEASPWPTSEQPVVNRAIMQYLIDALQAQNQEGCDGDLFRVRLRFLAGARG
jgi:GAF domain-containing protein